jgi:hypothetical protein
MAFAESVLMMREELSGVHLRDQQSADNRDKRRAAYEAVLMMSEDVCSAMDDARMVKAAVTLPVYARSTAVFGGYVTPVSPVHDTRRLFVFQYEYEPTTPSSSLESVLSDLDASLQQLQSRLNRRRSGEWM